jgi:hypothetical protein
MERSIVEKERKQTEQMEIIGENYHIWYDTIIRKIMMAKEGFNRWINERYG